MFTSSANSFPVFEPRAAEPPRTRRGFLRITCSLFNQDPHGSHRYFRGDQRTVCPGRPRNG